MQTFRLPRDYAIFLLVACVSAWPILHIFFGNGIFGMLGAAVLFGLGWLFGFFRGRRDPEFFSVWIIRIFKIQLTGERGFNGNRYIS